MSIKHTRCQDQIELMAIQAPQTLTILYSRYFKDDGETGEMAGGVRPLAALPEH